MTLLVQNQLTGYTANLRVGKIADQLLHSSRSDFRPYIDEDDDLRGCLCHACVHSNRLTTMLVHDDGSETRIPPAGQQFRRTVGRAV